MEPAVMGMLEMVFALTVNAALHQGIVSQRQAPANRRPQIPRYQLPMHPLPLLSKKLLPQRATGIAAEVLVVVRIFHLLEIMKGLHTAIAMPCSKPLKATHTEPNSMVPPPSLKHLVEAIG